ncbi:L,D-transpeptidase-like protein [Chryseobacterium sp. 52]|uniref:murein L,D-transpeptidase catalytic domain-containing protein n=1 Tax=Chryseobacterium sp. 52 TaxID=2035213 RepID=UPI000C1933FE|nr:murein L,D-transpeptidase catalytic domain family protein [Chryseobacterium sp. 52]PIF44771.1 L,D-transpeptidase-like protein [Chryseobacterium sp. 52]
MKIIALMLAVQLLFSCSNESQGNRPGATNPIVKGKAEEKPEADLLKITEKAEEALKFCASKKLSTDFCILIDMSLHSGIKRFFIWDFKTQSVLKEYLVGHGCGSNPWSLDGSKDHPKFSNEDGSHLSSLGKYKLEGRGHSEWGINIKYLMHGLEDTNSNALKRVIVFHSWDQMSDEEVFPKGSPEGWGCPTVSNTAMKEIDPMIRETGQPVLMWMYQ